MALLLYGAGLRLLECCQLRIKDVDFAANQITIRDGRGGKDRMTMLPGTVKADLAKYIERVRALHQRDLRQGAGWVELPWALARKYPNAWREWGWQWVFPATRFYIDRATGQRRRHHLHESVIQRAVREAVLKTGLAKKATCHTFRHSFATHLLEDRSRYPHRSGTAGPPGCEHDDDLHPRPEPWPGGRTEPGGPDVPVRHNRRYTAAPRVIAKAPRLVALRSYPAIPKPNRAYSIPWTPGATLHPRSVHRVTWFKIDKVRQI